MRILIFVLALVVNASCASLSVMGKPLATYPSEVNVTVMASPNVAVGVDTNSRTGLIQYCRTDNAGRCHVRLIRHVKYIATAYDRNSNQVASSAIFAAEPDMVVLVMPK